MWVNPLFRTDTTEAVLRLIADQSLATIVAADPGGSGQVTLRAGHMPLLAELTDDAELVLTGHIPRADPLSESIAAGTEVLCVLHGPRAYVSAGWYDSPGLPTYNYSVAHLSGRTSLLETADLRRHLIELVTAEESRKSPSDGGPWEPDQTAQQRIDDLLPDVIGFTVTVDRGSAKAKLGQNRTAEDRRGTIDQLSRSEVPEHQAVAAAMRDRSDRAPHTPGH